ncbi:uncharacterized protein [Littorina saxatilis]|uniref:uncharacterized protein n=1 Tax=Littorina saxatilis TaxID=31220 RepID=UPI0038B54F70
MKKKLLLCAVGLICLSYQIQLCKSSACHDFQFSVPLLENSSFLVPENTPLNVTLYVVGEGTCTSFSSGMIMVWQQDELTGNNSETLCVVGADKLTSTDCTCKRNNSVTPLECTITIDNIKRGKELLMRSTPNTTVEEKTVPINVAYPTTIIDFQINPSQEVEENDTVKVTCTWVNGNPLPRILIRNPKNQTIVSQHPDNQVLNAAIFEGNITCSDSGQYRCEAEGTDQYKAVDLMVKCPPRIMNDTEEKTVVLGSSAVFHFDVISYKNLTVCKLEEPKKNGPRNCSSDKTADE